MFLANLSFRPSSHVPGEWLILGMEALHSVYFILKAAESKLAYSLPCKVLVQRRQLFLGIDDLTIPAFLQTLLTTRAPDFCERGVNSFLDRSITFAFVLFSFFLSF